MRRTTPHSSSRPLEENRIDDPDELDPVFAALVMAFCALLGWLATVSLVWFAARVF